MKNKALALQSLFSAVTHMYNNDEEFRECFNRRIEVYANSLSEKERIKFMTAIKSFG